MSHINLSNETFMTKTWLHRKMILWMLHFIDEKTINISR